MKKQTDGLNKNTYYTYGTITVSGKVYDETRVYPHDKDSGAVSVTWADGDGNVVRSFTETKIRGHSYI